MDIESNLSHKLKTWVFYTSNSIFVETCVGLQKYCK